MRVIITAGGTGGHIYPALAIIDKIKEMEPQSEFLYIGTHNRMESEIVPARGISYMPIEIYGLSTSLKLMARNVKNVFLIEKAIKKCKTAIREFKPDIVIGVGGYVTYPVIKAAKSLGIKTFVHEQNSIPGKANLALHKHVDLYGVSFEDSLKYFKKYRAILTGNPCSEEALKAKKISKEQYGLTKNKKSVLIFNGSLGSTTMNKQMLAYLQNIEDENYEVLYITGKTSYESFSQNHFSKNVHIVSYVDHLCGLMKDMDLIVSRAGASSVAEITSLAIPTIFIPSPYVANNHQYYNALSIVNAKAGWMIEENKLTGDLLKEKIHHLLEDEEQLKEMKKNLKALSVDDSATRIYEEIIKLMNE